MWKSGDLVTPETFDSLTSYWLESRYPSMWDCLFVSPPWLEVWWREFGFEVELYLRSVRQGGTIIGIAPLLLRGAEASFIGRSDVCDYLDFVIVPGKEVEFFNLMLDDLKERNVGRLDLRCLRPDSTVLSHLIEVARDRKYEVSCQVEDISFELDLPPTWEKYLGTLTQKQRHEVRRKLRRFLEAGHANYHVIEDSESALKSVPVFLGLFRKSRQDKARFLTSRMESFFTSLIKSMARVGLLRLGILELNATPVATVICFDYHDTVFLYNNAYDPQYSLLSLGLVSKVLSIKDSIERGRGRFDFLKGDEEYKHRLGGKEVSLYGCHISLK